MPAPSPFLNLFRRSGVWLAWQRWRWHRAARVAASADRARMLAELPALGEPFALDQLSAALRDQDPVLRQFAADGLVALRATTRLTAALLHPSAHVRADAAEALGDTRDADAVHPLIVALRDGSPLVRSQAAYALGELGARDAVAPLGTSLRDPAPSVRRLSAYALGNIGDPAAIEPLMEALDDPDGEVRAAVASALHRLEDARTGESRRV